MSSYKDKSLASKNYAATLIIVRIWKIFDLFFWNLFTWGSWVMRSLWCTERRLFRLIFWLNWLFFMMRFSLFKDFLMNWLFFFTFFIVLIFDWFILIFFNRFFNIVIMICMLRFDFRKMRFSLFNHLGYFMNWFCFFIWILIVIKTHSFKSIGVWDFRLLIMLILFN